MKLKKIVIFLIFISILVVSMLNFKSTIFEKNNTKILKANYLTEKHNAEYQGLIVYANNLVANTTNETHMKNNTTHLQGCIDTVSEAGGGKVVIPAGKFYFKQADEIGREGLSYYVIKCKDNVIVEGAGTNESTGTILKPYAPNNDLPVDMFFFNELEISGNGVFLKNADYRNFIIDGEDAYCSSYNSAGKGFMINLFQDCDWENVIVKNTDGTGFGVDCPMNSTIKNCIAINCGKAGVDTSVGASGFGIGTGYSNDESMIISDCVAIGNKKFGFFFEHQGIFDSRNSKIYTATKSESLIVSNCKASGNLYDFGGSRANDVTFENCISYPSEANDRTISSIHFEKITRRTHVVNCKVDKQFTDVTDSTQYYYTPVYWAVNNGIAEGITKTEIGVNIETTKAQTITLLYRLAGRPGDVVFYSGGTSNPYSIDFQTGYTDVSTEASYVDAVKWAKDEGILDSTSTTFSPDAGCTRIEFITWLWKYAGQPTVSTDNHFTDIEKGTIYEKATNWAVAKGITSGIGDGTFGSNSICTRGAAITFLYRYANISNNYSIRYNLMGGTATNPTSYQSGTSEFTINNPTKVGYTFDGWTGSTYSGYVQNNYIAETTAKITTNDIGNKTFTANWTPNNYTVDFNANGGTGTMEKEYFIYDDVPQTLLKNNFKRTGYSFKEWNTKKDGTGKTYKNGETVQNLTTVQNGTVTLYAQWTAQSVQYKVQHYKQNIDGTYTTISETETLNAYAGTSVTPNVKTYAGFTAPSTQTVVVAEDGSTVIKYYYTRNSYTVTVNKGTGIQSVTGEGSYKYEEQVTLGATLKEGYENLSWNASETIPDVITTEEGKYTFKLPDVNDLRISASATPIEYEIRYRLWGEKDEIQTYTVEDKITLVTPVREGYMFIGWTSEQIEIPQKEVILEKGSIGNKEFTANWELNESNKLQLTVNYSETNPTNKDVTVLILSNTELKQVEGWKLAEDKMSMSKKYSENKTEEIEITNKFDDKMNVKIQINNIDKIASKIQLKYKYSEDKQKATVTLSSNEKLENIDGWYTEDNVTFTKQYNTNQIQELIVKDFAGNVASVKIIIDEIEQKQDEIPTIPDDEKDEKPADEDEQSKEDTTIKGDATITDKEIPKAGKKAYRAILIATLSIGIIAFKKYKKYKDF